MVVNPFNSQSIYNADLTFVTRRNRYNFNPLEAFGDHIEKWPLPLNA
jgi:hypothetical protein